MNPFSRDGGLTTLRAAEAFADNARDSRLASPGAIPGPAMPGPGGAFPGGPAPQPQPAQPQPGRPAPADPVVARAAVFRPLFRAAEQQYGVPAQLLEAIAYRESRFNPEARSPAGATGLMQFMPATAEGLGIDPRDPVQSVDGAARYLTQLHGRFGDWRKAVAAYHAGQGNVSKAVQKYGPHWLENGDEFRIGPITRDYVEEMEPIIGALEARPTATTAGLAGVPPTPQALPFTTDGAPSRQSVPPPTDAQALTRQPRQPAQRDPVPWTEEAVRRSPVNKAKLRPDGGFPTPEAVLALPDPWDIPDEWFQPGNETAMGERGRTGNFVIGTKMLGEAMVGALEMATGSELVGDIRDVIAESIEQDISSLRPQLQRERMMRWAETGPNSVWANPSAIFTQLVEQMPNALATIGPAMAAGRMAAGTGAIGRMFGANRGVARGVRAGLAGATAGAGAEATIVSGFAFNDIKDGISNASHADLMASPRYRELSAQFGEEQARRMLTMEVGRVNAALAGVSAAALAGLAGTYFGRLFGVKGFRDAGVVPALKARAGAAGRGFLVEGATEAPQEAMEQRFVNRAAAQTYDPAINPYEGMTEAAVAGGVLGGLTGGIFGAIGGGRRARPTQQPTEPPALEGELLPALPAPPAGPTGPGQARLTGPGAVPLLPAPRGPQSATGDTMFVGPDGTATTTPPAGYETTPAVEDVRSQLQAISPLFLKTYDDLVGMSQAELKRRATALGVSSFGSKAQLALRLMQEAVAIIDPDVDISGITLAEPTTGTTAPAETTAPKKAKTAAQKLADIAASEQQSREFPEAPPETSTAGQLTELRNKDPKGFEPLRAAIVDVSGALGEQGDVAPISGRIRATSKLAAWLDAVDRTLGDQFPDTIRRIRTALAEGDRAKVIAGLQELRNRYEARGQEEIPLTTKEAEAVRSARVEADNWVTQYKRDKDGNLIVGDDRRAKLISRRPFNPATGKRHMPNKVKQAASLGSYARALQRAIVKSGFQAPASVMSAISRAIRYNEYIVASEVSRTSQPAKKQKGKMADTKMVATQGVSEKVQFSKRNLANAFETMRAAEADILKALAEQESKRKPAASAVLEADIDALEQDVRTRPANKLFRVKEARAYLKESLAYAGQYVRLVREEIARRHDVIKDKLAAVDREYDRKVEEVKDKHLGKPIRGIRRAKQKGGHDAARREIRQVDAERQMAKGDVTRQYADDVVALGEAAQNLDEFVAEIQQAREDAAKAARLAKAVNEGTPSLAGTSQIVQGAGPDNTRIPIVPEELTKEEEAARTAQQKAELDVRRQQQIESTKPATAEEKAAVKERLVSHTGDYTYGSENGDFAITGAGLVATRTGATGAFLASLTVNTDNALVLDAPGSAATTTPSLVDALRANGIRVPILQNAGQLRVFLSQVMGVDVLVLGRGSTVLVLNNKGAQLVGVTPSTALGNMNNTEARQRIFTLAKDMGSKRWRQVLNRRTSTDIGKMLRVFEFPADQVKGMNKAARVDALMKHVAKFGPNPLLRVPTAAEQKAFDNALPAVPLETPPATMTVEETKSQEEMTQEESILAAIAAVAELDATKKQLDQRRAEATTEAERQQVDTEIAAFMSNVARQYYDEQRGTAKQEVVGEFVIEPASAQNVTKAIIPMARELGLLDDGESVVGNKYADMIREQVLPEFNTAQWRMMVGFVDALRNVGMLGRFQKLADAVVNATSSKRLALAEVRLAEFLGNINGFQLSKTNYDLVSRFVHLHRKARMAALEATRDPDDTRTVTKQQKDWLDNLPPAFKAELIEMGILKNAELMDFLYGRSPLEVQRAVNELTIEQEFSDERMTSEGVVGTDTDSIDTPLYHKMTMHEMLRAALHSRLTTSVMGVIAPDTAQWLRVQSDALLRTRNGEASFTLREMLSRLQSELTRTKNNHALGPAFSALVDRLVSLDLDVAVKVRENITVDGDSAGISGMYVRSLRTIELAIDPEGEVVRNARGPSDADAAAMLHTLLHEAVHAATVDNLLLDANTNRELHQEIHDIRVAFVDAMYDKGWIIRLSKDSWALTNNFFADTGLDQNTSPVRKVAMQEALYGIQSNREFVAELFTNADLQAILSALEAPAGAKQPKRTLWQRFINAITSAFFGPNSSPGHTTMLEWAVSVSGRAFQTEKQVRRLHDANNRLARAFGGASFQRMRIPTAEETTAALNNSRETGWANIKGWARRGNLGGMDLDFMEREFRGLVDKAVKLHGRIVGNVNPLTQYIAASHRAMGYARDVQARAAKLVKATYELAPETREALGELERDSTIARIFPDVPLNHASNQHNFRSVKTGEGVVRQPKPGVEAKYAALRARWLALKPSGAAALYTQRHTLNQELFQRRLLESLSLLGRKYGFDKGQIAMMLSARTTLQVGKLIDSGKLPVEAKDKEQFLKRHKDMRASTIEGPYFHLHREGNYFVTTTDDGKQYTAQWRNETLAKRDVARLQAEGRKAVLSRKLTSGVLGQSLQSTVADILMHIPHEGILKAEERAAFKQTLEAALVSVLAENSLIESSRMQRKSVEGVRGADMISGYGDYVAAATYAIGDLATMHEISESLKSLNQLQKADNYETPISDDDVLRIGEIADELKLRLKQNAAHRDVSALERGAAAIGFYGFLGSPAYWMLNMTQTAVVGLPILAARVKTTAGRSVGMIAAAGALTKAYREIASLSGDGRMLDVDAFIAAARAKHGDAKANVIQKMLEDGTISSNFAQEITDLTRKFKGTAPTVWKLLAIFEDMPKRIEHFNRISMAWAATDLGADYLTARDVTRESQFMYDPVNRARLLRFAPLWAGGGLRALITPMMMFKVFGVNMARVLYGNAINAISKAKTPQERAEAIRVVGGIIFTHTLAGGLLGGTSLGVVQALGAAFNSMLDDDEKVDWGMAVQDFLADNMGEYAANVAMKGLPAAVGVDFSASINLGNLLWMSQGDIDLAQRGGWERLVYSFTGPVARHLGDTAQYSARYLQGEATTSELLSRAVPLKLAKGTFRAFTMAEGLKSGDQIFARPDSIGIPGYVLTATGFRSARVSQLQQRFYSDRNSDRNLEQGKQKLLREAAIATTFGDKLKAQRKIQKWNLRMSKRNNPQLIIANESILRSKTAREELQRQYDAGQFRTYN